MTWLLFVTPAARVAMSIPCSLSRSVAQAPWSVLGVDRPADVERGEDGEDERLQERHEQLEPGQRSTEPGDERQRQDLRRRHDERAREHREQAEDQVAGDHVERESQ